MKKEKEENMGEMKSENEEEWQKQKREEVNTGVPVRKKNGQGKQTTVIIITSSSIP